MFPCSHVLAEAFVFLVINYNQTLDESFFDVNQEHSI